MSKKLRVAIFLTLGVLIGILGWSVDKAYKTKRIVDAAWHEQQSFRDKEESKDFEAAMQELKKRDETLDMLRRCNLALQKCEVDALQKQVEDLLEVKNNKKR